MEKENYDIYTTAYINNLLSLFNPPYPFTIVTAPASPSLFTKTDHNFSEGVYTPLRNPFPLRYFVTLRSPFIANERAQRLSRDANNQSRLIQPAYFRSLHIVGDQSSLLQRVQARASINTESVDSWEKSKRDKIEKNLRKRRELNKLRPSVIRRSISTCDKNSTSREAICTILNPNTTQHYFKSLSTTDDPKTSHVQDRKFKCGSPLTKKRRTNSEVCEELTTNNPKDPPESLKLPLLLRVQDSKLESSSTCIGKDKTSNEENKVSTTAKPKMSPESLKFHLLPCVEDSKLKSGTISIVQNGQSTGNNLEESPVFTSAKRTGFGTMTLRTGKNSVNSNKDLPETNVGHLRRLPTERQYSTKNKEPTKKKHRFSCSFCQKGFNWLSHWQAHERVHTGEKPFKCDICSRRFKRADGLHCHKAVHNKKKVTQCAVCSKKFRKKESYEEHLFEHTGVTPFVCEHCNTKIADTERIENHLVRHKEKKHFTCQYCKQVFINAKRLVKHIRKHTGERLFKCQLCNMSFTKKSALFIHYRVHTGVKPYTCNQCERRFSIKGNLLRHQLIHTGERPFKCNQCDKTYNNPSHLTRHKTRHHNVENK